MQNRGSSVPRFRMKRTLILGLGHVLFLNFSMNKSGNLRNKQGDRLPSLATELDIVSVVC
ncbi:hypothetical protein HYALB_00012801 [Hymenoscyphus albidus]|uniref:Uncharacterized protein n=1 Tax=Hymenoscyphus albidus TaxID=595503 RepID=A0A9N9Q9S2_9HELO|nr:hypothetical protein HYALB_00012801 [Hymenoscyphus albidus]